MHTRVLLATNLSTRFHRRLPQRCYEVIQFMAYMNQLSDSHIQLMWSVAAPVVGQANASTNVDARGDAAVDSSTNSAVHQSIRHGVLRVLTDVVTSLGPAHLVALVRSTPTATPCHPFWDSQACRSS